MPKTIRTDPTAPQMIEYRSGETPGTIGTLAFCTRDRLSAGTFISMLMADRSSFLRPGENLAVHIVQGHVLTAQRNECVQNMQGDWILFIDDDMTFQPDAIRLLIERQREHDLDMVSALCFQRISPHQPTLYMRETPSAGNYTFLEDWEPGEVIEVDATGLAFVLITRRILERIAGEFPSFEERQRFNRAPSYFRWDERGYGEDMAFCQDVRAAGGRIFVDTGIKTGHVSEMIVTEETFLDVLSHRPDDLREKVTQMNDRFGLPTVTPERALERLEALRG